MEIETNQWSAKSRLQIYKKNVPKNKKWNNEWNKKQNEELKLMNAKK